MFIIINFLNILAIGLFKSFTLKSIAWNRILFLIFLVFIINFLDTCIIMLENNEFLFLFSLYFFDFFYFYEVSLEYTNYKFLFINFMLSSPYLSKLGRRYSSSKSSSSSTEDLDNKEDDTFFNFKPHSKYLNENNEWVEDTTTTINNSTTEAIYKTDSTSEASGAEIADTIVTWGENASNVVAGVGTAFTASAVQKAPTNQAKAIALSGGIAATATISTGLKVGSNVIANKIRKAPDELFNNDGPPSPGDWTASSIFENEWLINFFPNYCLNSDEGKLLIVTFLLTLLSLFFLCFCYGNYIIRNRITPWLKKYITNPPPPTVVRYNNNISYIFNFYYFLMVFI